MYENQILNLVKRAAPRNPLAYVNNIVKEYAAENLKNVMLACREIDYNTHRTSFSGNIHADIMVISDYPRSNSPESLEDTDEKEVITKVFDALGYNSESLFYIDAINLIPAREIGGKMISRLPNKSETESSKVFVDHAIDIVKPKAILLLGPIASGMYMNTSFTEAKHSWTTVNGVPAIPTIHPEKILNKDNKLHEEDLEDLKELFILDIESVIKKINN